MQESATMKPKRRISYLEEASHSKQAHYHVELASNKNKRNGSHLPTSVGRLSILWVHHRHFPRDPSSWVPQTIGHDTKTIPS